MSILTKFYYKNLLKRAEDGAGDGTKYATATSATIDQDNKQFTLSGLSIIADLGADANDKFNGFILYFPESGNKYHIVDWDAASDMATVFETPHADDIDDCEIRLKLCENTSLVSQPAHRLADGKTNTFWEGSGENQTQAIRFALPNLIEDGGFEAQAAGNVASPWSAQSAQWQISATNPLLGSRMSVYTQSAADAYLKQSLVATAEKGKTYRILIKAQAIGADPPGAVLQIKVRQRLSSNKIIDSDMDWQPTITTTAAWLATIFTADFSSDMLEIFINALGASGSWGSCTGLRIDEIYIYENIAADRLIVEHGHNWNNGEITSVYGCTCWPERTSFSYANDASANLAANVDIDGTETIFQSLTSSDYPVWEIKLTAASGIAYSAALLFLGPQMTFPKQMDRPFDPEAEEITGIINETAGGRRVFHCNFYRGGPYNLILSNVNATFYALLKDWWQEVGRNKFPFWFCFDEANHSDEIKLVRCESNWLFQYDPVFRRGSIELKEEI